MRAAFVCAVVYLYWTIVLIDASAAVEAPTNFPEADNAVCKALLNRDLGNWAKTIEKQPPSNNVAELLQRFSVLVRAGHLKSARPVIDALANANPAWSKDEWTYIPAWLIQRRHWDLTRYCLEKFPRAEPWHVSDMIAGWDTNGGTQKEIDKWLTKRSAANFDYWLAVRLRYRGNKGTADELLKSMAAEVKSHPHDIQPAIAYLKAIEDAGVTTDVTWMADVCKPTLAYDTYKLAQRISRNSVPASIILFNRSLQTPFTEADMTAMQHGEQPQQDKHPTLSPENQLRIATKEELVQAYQQTKQLDKARPLIAELTALAPSGLPPSGLERIAGEAEPTANPSASDNRVRNAEATNKNSAKYWVARAEYFAGRKAVKEAADAYDKAWTLALLDPQQDSFKDPRLFKSQVLFDYMRFWMQVHGAVAASELMWTKLKDVPLNGQCARRAISHLLYLEFESSDKDGHKPKLIRGDDTRLWSFLTAQRVWDISFERLIWQMITNPPPEGQEQLWKRAEQLAKNADVSRAYTLGWVMTRVGGKELKRRAIPWLEDAMARYTVAEDREKAAFELFDAAIEIDDWRVAKRVWPLANRHVSGEDALSRLGKLAVAMANAEAPDEAMKQWSAVANIDRWELEYLHEMVKAGMGDRLIAFYQQMAHDDPASEVPAEAFRRLKAN